MEQNEIVKKNVVCFVYDICWDCPMQTHVRLTALPLAIILIYTIILSLIEMKIVYAQMATLVTLHLLSALFAMACKTLLLYF